MKKKILLIDDDNVAHFINKKLLEISGLTDHIYSFNNGEEAIRFITNAYQHSEFVPDIIFLDVNMPVMNGFEFIEQLRKLSYIPQEKMKIIILSSSSHERDRAMAVELGVTNYLNKPLSAQVIQTLFS